LGADIVVASADVRDELARAVAGRAESPKIDHLTAVASSDVRAGSVAHREVPV
jgi:hypothetical protein